MGISVETLNLAKAFCINYIAEHADEFGGVEEIYQADSVSDFPSTGDLKVLYVDKATGSIYRWNGSNYSEISSETIKALAVAANNDKVIGIVNGAFAAVNQTRDPLSGMDVAANNGKIVGIVNGAFTPVGIDSLIDNGDVIEY